MVVTAMTQEEAGELLAGLTQAANGGQTSAREIADRLMSRIRNPDSGQFTGTMQLGRVNRVPAVGLDPVSRFARDQRRSHDDAFMPGEGQLSLNPIAARSSLIAEPKLAPDARQLRRQSLHSRRRVRDLAIFAHIVPDARFGKRHCDRVLVHVKTDVCDNLTQDPSPMHEARCRNPGATLDKPA